MKGALIVGIDDYPGQARLHGSVNDAVQLASLLESNEDGSLNFQVQLQKDVQNKANLRTMIARTFSADLHTALFYFSGHGCITDRGGYIVTPDFKSNEEGIPMEDILQIVNSSGIKDKIVIIDCCHSGFMGEPVAMSPRVAQIAEGVVMITAARKMEQAMEVRGHGVFTWLLLEALKGGAADIVGHITPGSVYSFIERSLGFLQQRPTFKANVNRFISLRQVSSKVPIELVLRKITGYFPGPDHLFPLDPSFEEVNEGANVDNVSIFRHLQKLHYAGLVEPEGEEFMFWAAQRSRVCKLTPLGKHYWKLVNEKKI